MWDVCHVSYVHNTIRGLSMPPLTMGSPEKIGEIRVRIHLENTVDLLEAREKKDVHVRSHDMDAIVDTGAVLMQLPQDVVENLGLPLIRRTNVRYADDRTELRDIAGPITVEILARAMETSCIVDPPGSEALVGQIELERLDLIADCGEREIYPRHDSPYPTLRI